MSLGFVALGFEAGRPLRICHLLRNLRHSWISRETLAAVVFVLFACLDWLFPELIFQILAAAGAVGLMISHGFMLFYARAVGSWNMPLTPLLLTTSSLYGSFGAILLFSAFDMINLRPHSITVGLIIIAINMLMWAALFNRKREPASGIETEVLCRPHRLILVLGIGHLLPILLLARLAFHISVYSELDKQQFIFLLAGISILFIGVWQKIDILRTAAYMRGVVMGQPKSNM